MLVRELGGRRTAMSRAMGVSYPTILKKVAAYGLDVRSLVAETARAAADGRLAVRASPF